MTFRSLKTYWTATGVIPRWQLVLVYALIVGAGVVGFAKIMAQQDDIKDLVASIQKSRVFLTVRSCRRTNNERAITRANLRQNMANLAQVPDAGLQELGFTRAQAVAQIRAQIRKIPPIDCKKQVREVAGKRVVPGGGSGSPQGARRPSATENPSKGTRHGDGGQGPSVPGGPSEPRTPPQTEPSPGDGKPPVGNPSQPSGPNPSVKPPVVTVPDVRELPRQVAPELCEIQTPLGPILKLCP